MQGGRQRLGRIQPVIFEPWRNIFQTKRKVNFLYGGVNSLATNAGSLDQRSVAKDHSKFLHAKGT